MSESTGQLGALKGLKGRRVMVTRPREQLTELAEGLRVRGADVVEAPVIRIEPPLDKAPLAQAIQRLAEYDWIVFTSANGVRFLRAGLRELGKELREIGQAKLAAIGPATAATLEAEGLRVDVVPERFIAEEIFAALERFGPVDDCRVLLPRADIAREALPNLLRAAGASVDVVVAYRTVSVSEELASAMQLISDGQDRCGDVYQRLDGQKFRLWDEAKKCRCAASSSLRALVPSRARPYVRRVWSL